VPFSGPVRAENILFKFLLLQQWNAAVSTEDSGIDLTVAAYGLMNGARA